MGRLNEYHSYEASARKSPTWGWVVRIKDRYYPGPPGPEYSTVLTLEPHEAFYLGKELLEAAEEAKKALAKDRQDEEIRVQTAQIAEAAKWEAND